MNRLEAALIIFLQQSNAKGRKARIHEEFRKILKLQLLQKEDFKSRF